ncbi:AAA family ATPase [Dickeya fangzhongdai]|uniref:ATP-dependent nuclease n=1 Tax=Dickeya fangzhongdai TaxID=1778540 RepID=UPI00330782B1
MKINKIRVKNYRSIRTELLVDFDNLLTIIGPNNSGKSNFLKAIFLFFDSVKNDSYSISDLPFGVSGEQTSISISFIIEHNSSFLQSYKELASLLEEEKGGDDLSITLYLSFSSTGKPIYRFFTNDKIKPGKKEDFRRMQEELVSDFLGTFSCKYIPSEKNSGKLFSDFFVPHLKRYIGELIQDQQEKVSNALYSVSSSIDKNFSDAGLSGIKCEFELPNGLFSSALSNFDFFINDGEKTHFFMKGSGIQAATTLACFKWITSQESKYGKHVIWLIEEPESYLHPALIDSCRKMIQDLSTVSTVFATTHAIGFIPSDHNKILKTSLTKEKGTYFDKFKGYAEATDSIRSSLGVKFSDYYSLTEFNVFVEGKTDKLIIEHMLSLIKTKGVSNKFEALRKASIMDFSGTGSLKDFLKATYSFMYRERSIVVVFDGDDAGLKATKDLNGYFGNKSINFSSNQEYIILPNRAPIEALFPEEWLEELSKESDWIKIERDVNNKLVSLNMKGEKKMNIAKWLIDKSVQVTKDNNGTYQWASNFINVFKKIDGMLKNNAK